MPSKRASAPPSARNMEPIISFEALMPNVSSNRLSPDIDPDDAHDDFDAESVESDSIDQYGEPLRLNTLTESAEDSQNNPDSDYRSDPNAVEYSVHGHTAINLSAYPPSPHFTPPLEANDHEERLEWQHMLSNVLQGDVLKTEKTRISLAGSSDSLTVETRRKDLAYQLWIRLRAYFRGHDVEDETRFLTTSRLKVDSILDEFLKFRVQPADADLFTGWTQVYHALHRYEWVESLYPSFNALRADKVHASDVGIVHRIEALQAWSNTVHRIYIQFGVIERWIKISDAANKSPFNDVTTPMIDPIEISSSPLPPNADLSPLIEYMFREENAILEFGHRTLRDICPVAVSSKATMLKNKSQFVSMNLPLYLTDLVVLMSFPPRLLQETINLLVQRLRLHVPITHDEDPSHDLSSSLVLLQEILRKMRTCFIVAAQIRANLIPLLTPDPRIGWTHLPGAIPIQPYDDATLDAFRFFFTILGSIITTGHRTVIFKETDILEDEMFWLTSAAMLVPGGDVLIAENYCNLTHRLLQRVFRLFTSQLHTLPSVNILPRFNDNLDNVRLRHRKLLRFCHLLLHRFENAIEFSLRPSIIDLGTFIETLGKTGHILVYTGSTEKRGVYIFVNMHLREKPEQVLNILTKCFANPPRRIPNIQEIALKDFNRLNTFKAKFDRLPEDNPVESNILDEYVLDSNNPDDVKEKSKDSSKKSPQNEDEEEEKEQLAPPCYALLITPREPFIWSGPVMNIDVPHVEAELRERRIRLISEGSERHLVRAKREFMSVFPDMENHIIAEGMANLSRLNHEVKKVKSASFRLAQSIIGSVERVNRVTKNSELRETLMAGYFVFAAELGQRSLRSSPRKYRNRLQALLMKFASRWIAFICNDCDPTSERTFKLAVTALEFIMNVTKGTNILHLPKDDFQYLRVGVAQCMALLISHFDILGARSSLESKRAAEAQARKKAKPRDNRVDTKELQAAYGVDAQGHVFRSPTDANEIRSTGYHFREPHYDQRLSDGNLNPLRMRWLNAIDILEEERMNHKVEQKSAGRVLEMHRAELETIKELARAKANINMKWQLTRFIGGGSHGSVYLAINLDSGYVMAAKEIRFQGIASIPALAAQIRDEMTVMEKLNHPNIVEYYGIEVQRDRVYIFEEFCPGGSLSDLLENGPLEEEDSCKWFVYQLLDGLVYMHSKEIAHRDIKPGNILVNEKCVLKYADFGAAKSFGGGKDEGSSQKTTTIPTIKTIGANAKGTPMYLAPEVIKGTGNETGSMDIWSLGCVVLELVTGRKPWEELDNEWAVMYRIGETLKPPTLPDESQLSAVGIDFIRSCLILDPSKRPTADELFSHPWIADIKSRVAANQEPFMESEASERSGFDAISPTESFPFASPDEQTPLSSTGDDVIPDPVISESDLTTLPETDSNNTSP